MRGPSPRRPRRGRSSRSTTRRSTTSTVHCRSAPLGRARDPPADEGRAPRSSPTTSSSPSRPTTQDDNALDPGGRARPATWCWRPPRSAARARRTSSAAPERTGLPFSRGIAANSNYRVDVDDRIRQMPFSPQRLVSFPIVAARTALGHPSRTCRAATARGSTSRARPERSPGSATPTSRAASSSPATVRGKIVVVGATAAVASRLHSTSTSRRRAHGRSRDPGRVDRHRARRLPAARRPALARRRCCSSRSARRAARRAADCGSSWRWASASSRWRCSSSAPRSPSTTT